MLQSPRSWTRVLSLTLGLAFAAGGCGLGSPVSLLTADGGRIGCYTSNTAGDLVVDSTYGTAILEKRQISGGTEIVSMPVRWPFGYSGRRAGSEVEVLDGTGQVVARTGTHIFILGGYEGGDPPAWSACDRVMQDGRNLSVQVIP